MTGAEDSRKRRRAAPRVLIAAGGTGGHVYPGLAVAEALLRLAGQSEVRFAGTRRGLEKRLVPAAGYRLHRLPASGFRGVGVAARARFAANLLAGCAGALLLLLRWRPGVVLGTGGYASLAPLLAARALGCPVALQEQNAVPGSANRLLSRVASRVYLGYPDAAHLLPRTSCLVTGNPVRAAFAAPATAAERPPGALRLLVFGGSRGARTLNRAVSEASPRWRGLAALSLRVQTGEGERDSVAAAFAGWPPERVRVEAYIDDMAEALRWADLAVCRAGALTLAELAAAGRPAVLVPFPHATDDHQVRNARAVEAAGAALVLRDEECDGVRLAAAVEELASAPDRLAAMAAASARLARPEAADVIARDLLALAGAPACAR